MVLHRGREAEVVGEFANVVAAAARSEARNSLTELNSQCLELLSEQALAQPAQANLFLHHVGELWRSLDEQSRRRVASCPYLLLDAGFSNPGHWRWLDERHVNEAPPPPYNIFFTVPRAPTVARQIFIYAWHLVQSRNCFWVSRHSARAASADARYARCTDWPNGIRTGCARAGPTGSSSGASCCGPRQPGKRWRWKIRNSTDCNSSPVSCGRPRFTARDVWATRI
jgi:hypothetical protein